MHDKLATRSVRFRSVRFRSVRFGSVRCTTLQSRRLRNGIANELAVLGFGWDAPANRSAIADIQTAREQVQICANGVGAEVGVGVVAFVGSATGDGGAEGLPRQLRCICGNVCTTCNINGNAALENILFLGPKCTNFPNALRGKDGS